jgi:riboflavin biosynthesis pyrimidine reductase
MTGFTHANSPENALELLEKQGFKEVIVTGGATINSEFAKRGLVDEVILSVNPVILGEGIPLFAPSDFEMKLKLIGTEKVGEDILELRYKVVK